MLVMVSRLLLSVDGARLKVPGTIAGGWVSMVNVTWKLPPGTPSPEGRGSWLVLGLGLVGSMFSPSRALPWGSRRTLGPVPSRITRYSSLLRVRPLPARLMMRVWVALSKESLPERLMKRSSGLLLLPKMPSPPEASSRTDWALIVVGSIRLLNWMRMVSGDWFEPATPPDR